MGEKMIEMIGMSATRERIVIRPLPMPRLGLLMWRRESLTLFFPPTWV